MNVKEFLKKYKIIVVLVAMIVVLAFVKSYFGKEIDDNLIDITPTAVPTLETTRIQNTPTITNISNTPNSLSEENNSQNNEVLIDDLVTNEKYDELVAVEGDDPIQVSQLSNKLPYEGDTFVVKSIISNNLLLAKSKIDDLEKAESDLRDWLSTKGMNFADLVVAWE